MNATVSSQTPFAAPIARGMSLIIGFRVVMPQQEIASRWGRHHEHHFYDHTMKKTPTLFLPLAWVRVVCKRVYVSEKSPVFLVVHRRTSRHAVSFD